MRRTILTLVAGIAAAVPTTAGAAVPHVVQPGETLWTIASANNLTNRAFAAYNGLDPEGNVILGSTVQVPSPAEAAAAMTRLGWAPAPPPAAPAPATPASAAAPSAPPPMGGYTVRWGDTLSGLAATARVPVSTLAAANGLNPSGILLAGTVIKLPTGAPTPARAAQPAPAPVVAQAAPAPTPGRATAEQISSIAAANGVPGSLAAALAWQESGFNNAMVSAANARGVMQILPGTWEHIQTSLSSTPLDPNSVTDNIKAGVLYLGHLLRETGGDQATAVASYYQGLGSVQSRGMLDETKQYVANVQALQGRFGG